MLSTRLDGAIHEHMDGASPGCFLLVEPPHGVVVVWWKELYHTVFCVRKHQCVSKERAMPLLTAGAGAFVDILSV
jgi:hypothetical protein